MTADPTIASATSDARSVRDTFVDSVRRAVPASALDPRTDVPIGELAIGAVDRSGVLRACEILAGGFPSGFDARGHTLDELSELAQVASPY